MSEPAFVSHTVPDAYCYAHRLGLCVGDGRNRERTTMLERWQQEIVDREPHAFLRGLVESGGCRVVNRFKTKLPSGRVADYAYPRYFFTDASPEVRRLFGATCERIGVHWTQSNRRTISVADRASVAVLDAFIGPQRVSRPSPIHSNPR